jgi:lysophospholipase L1-like esterase
MKRVLIAGDSLSLPRHEADVSYEQIYPIKVQLDLQRDIVVNGSLRGNSSEGIASESYLAEFVLPLRPHHVVLQLGIVDCTPRLFTPGEKLALSAMSRIPALRWFSKWIIDTASRHRPTLTRWRRHNLVKADDFDRHLRSFAEAARRANPLCEFTVVNIPCPTDIFVRNNHRVGAIIERYNDILEQLALDLRGALIDLHTFTRSYPTALLSDGYHLDIQAHDFLARELLQRLGHPPPIVPSHDH